MTTYPSTHPTSTYPTSTQTSSPIALVRPRHDRVLAGVCSGLARRFGMQASTVRLLFALSILLPGPQVLAYLVLWAIMPSER